MNTFYIVRLSSYNEDSERYAVLSMQFLVSVRAEDGRGVGLRYSAELRSRRPWIFGSSSSLLLYVAGRLCLTQVERQNMKDETVTEPNRVE